MPEFKELLQSAPAQKLMGDDKTLERLKNSPEASRLMDLLGRQAGGNLDQITQSAADGDTAQLMGAVEKLLRDPESQKLLGELSRTLKL